MESNKSILILLIGIFCSVDFISTNRFYELFPKPFVCTVLDPKLVYNYTCITKVINRTFHLNSRELIFNPGIEVTNYYIDIQILRKVGSVFRRVLQVEQDMCEFTKGTSNPGATILTRVMNIDGRRKFGNMFDPCPLSGRRYEKDAIIDYGKMPEIVPAGEYRVDILGYMKVNGKRNDFILTQCSTSVIAKLIQKKG